MKRLNKAGFTLIELLAVITIMGILMLVAIPSVSRTIENSRRDTFADNALTYVNTVRNAVLADEIICDGVTASATANGTYYISLDTGTAGGNAAVIQQTKDLMEKPAKSSWGSAELTGYIRWVKSASGSGVNQRTTTTYYVCLRDSGNHGFSAEFEEKLVGRGSIVTASANACTIPTGSKICTLK